VASNGYVKMRSVVGTQQLQSDPPPPHVKISDSNEAAFHAYVFDCVQSIGDTAWLAELRRISALSVNFPDLIHTSTNALEQIQLLMLLLQEIVYKYEGCIKELIIDDKGATLIVLFGVPPFAHEDDSIRAIRAAMTINSRLDLEGMHTKIGIATGRCFCGIIGGEIRREYTIIGEVMNLASRMMQAASENQILCNEKTFEFSKKRFNFDSTVIRVKGKTDAITVHSPRKELETSARSFGQIVGREAERRQLSTCLDDLLRGQSRIVVIEGEPGIGKSRLTFDLLEEATKKGIRRLAGSADPIESFTAFYAWRSIFDQLFGLGDIGDLQVKRMRVLSALDSEQELRELAPLLNPVLPLDLPDNEVTAQMTGQVRAENTRELLVRILQSFTKPSLNEKPVPLLIVLEDAHWMDSASWALARMLCLRHKQLLLVIVTWPIDQNVPSEFSQLLQAPNAIHMRLGNLSLENTSEIVRQHLGLRELEQSIAKVIQERSGGNPFFCQEIAYALRDSNVLTIRDGIARIAAEVNDLSSIPFPNTLQGVITTRIDRLAASQQLALKVASVIGREFEYRTLSAIHPMHASNFDLGSDLDNLRRLDLILREKLEPYLTYLFKHAITQEVAYNLLLFAHRRQLHTAIARYYEASQSEDLGLRYPLLAYHCGRAGVDSKTLEYSEKSGEEALRNGAFKEAINYFSQTLEVLDSLEGGGGESNSSSFFTRRAHYEMQLGHSYYGLGNWGECQNHHERGLAIMNRAPPRSDTHLLASIMKQTLVQILHRLWPAVLTSKQMNSKDNNYDNDFLEISLAYDNLFEIAMWENKPKSALNAIVTQLNLAEKAGSAPELAKAYTAATVVCGAIPIHRFARMYGSLARRTAEKVSQFSALAAVYAGLGVYETGIAEWEQTRSDLERSVRVAEKASDWNRYEESVTCLASYLYLEAKFYEAIEQWTRLLSHARQRGNLSHQSWSLCGLGQNKLRIGETNEAIRSLGEALEIMDEKRVERAGVQQAHGVLSMACIRAKNYEKARLEAETILGLIKGSRPTLFTQFEG
jgi:predicted ATPase